MLSRGASCASAHVGGCPCPASCLLSRWHFLRWHFRPELLHLRREAEQWHEGAGKLSDTAAPSVQHLVILYWALQAMPGGRCQALHLGKVICAQGEIWILGLAERGISAIPEKHQPPAQEHSRSPTGEGCVRSSPRRRPRGHPAQHMQHRARTYLLQQIEVHEEGTSGKKKKPTFPKARNQSSFPWA